MFGECISGRTETHGSHFDLLQKIGLRWVSEFSVSRTQIETQMGQSEEREVTFVHTGESHNHDLGVM